MLLLDVIIDIFAVVFYILGGFVDSLEEVHQESQADIDLHLVHVVEYLCGFAFAVDGEGYFGFVFPESFFSEVDPVFPWAVPFFGCLVVLFKEEFAVDFDDIFDEEGYDIPELVDGFPQSQKDGGLEETQNGVEKLKVADTFSIHPSEII